MLLSPLRITWNPGGIVLLDYGDETADHCAVSADQDSSAYTPLGQVWADGKAEGGLRRSVAFTTVRVHPNRTEAQDYQQRYSGTLPFATTGTLTVQIQGGASFSLASTVLVSAQVALLPDRGNCTETSFRLTCGKLTRL